MDESDISIVTSVSKSPKKGSAKITGLDSMIRSVVDYCTKGEEIATTTKRDKVKDNDVVCEDLPRTELFELINQHKLHLKFLQENDMCSDEEKLEIVNEVKKLFNITNGQSRKRREEVDDNSSNKRRVSN